MNIQDTIKNIIFKRGLKSDEELIREEILFLLWDKTGNNNLLIKETKENLNVILDITEKLSMDLIASAAEKIDEFVNQIIENENSCN